MENTFLRIVEIIDSIQSEDLVEVGRLNDKAFTRDRKLTFENLLWVILNKHGLSAAIELYAHYQRQETASVTKQSFSTARLNLNPEVFKILNNTFTDSYYNTNEVTRSYGFITFAIDGSVQDLVNDAKLIQEYGGVTDENGEVVKVKAQSSGILDVNSHLMVDFEIAPYETSEIELAKKNIEKLLEKFPPEEVLLIFDRGYPSIEFYYYLMQKGVKFLFRLPENRYKDEKKKMKTKDELVDLELNKSRLQNIEDGKLKDTLLEKGSLRVRITEFKLDNGVNEVLLSNLCLDELGKDDLKDLYRQRWEIERSFDVLKNKLYMENVSGYSKIAVEQDFHSQILVHNIIQDIKNEGDRILEEKRKQKELQEKMYNSLKKT